MSTKATIKVVLYKWKTYSNGEHPLCVRITKDRKQHYRSINGETCHPKYWSKKKNEPTPSCPKKEHLDRMTAQAVGKYEEAQQKLLEEGTEITVGRIIQKAENAIEKITVLDFYERIISELDAKGKVSNSRHYNDVRVQFTKFLKEKKHSGILFGDIDFNLLQEWETYLRKRDVLETTLFAYLKNLRALYREAINRGAAKEQDYPFKRYKLSKFDTDTEKTHISNDLIDAIERADLSKENPTVQMARKYALFSYYTFGMNLKDMAHLRWTDIKKGDDGKGGEQDYLHYRRMKTGKRQNVPLLDEAREIIEFFRPRTHDGPFVLPILDPEQHQTETQRHDRIKKVRSQTNRALKRIGKLAGIEENLTMYVFRHSFATHLYRKGIPAPVIQQFLGHKTETQTRNYLRDLEASQLVEAAQKLVNDGE